MLKDSATSPAVKAEREQFVESLSSWVSEAGPVEEVQRIDRGIAATGVVGQPFGDYRVFVGERSVQFRRPPRFVCLVP